MADTTSSSANLDSATIWAAQIVGNLCDIISQLFMRLER